MNILRRLSVEDISRCAQVCRLWNHLTKQKVLWTDILPTQWARGEGSFHSKRYLHVNVNVIDFAIAPVLFETVQCVGTSGSCSSRQLVPKLWV